MRRKPPGGPDSYRDGGSYWRSAFQSINYSRIKINLMSDPTVSWQVKANEFVIPVSKEQLESADIIKRSPLEFHLVQEHRSVSARVLSAEPGEKKMTVEVEGETYVIEIKDELDQMLDKMGFNTLAHKTIKEIRAPMPGLVLEIAVTVGQDVKEGEKILILEAMKMENSIVIHADATIKKIHVKSGQAVEKGQVLVELE